METIFVIMALGTLAAAAYLLPVLIGAARGVPDIGALAVVNILLGWTFAGWVIALAMALRSARPVAPAVHIVQHLPSGAWPGPDDWRRPPDEEPLAIPPPSGTGSPPDWPGWGEER